MGGGTGPSRPAHARKDRHRYTGYAAMVIRRAGQPPQYQRCAFSAVFQLQPEGGLGYFNGATLDANWNATQDKWAIPLGLGTSKTFKLGDQLMQLSAFYYTYVARPVSSPQTNLKVVWSLLYPIKRGIDIQELIKENQ